MGQNTFMRLVNNTCKLEKLKGKDLKSWSWKHDLIELISTILLEHDHPDSSVVPRADHLDLNSVKCYQNLREAIRLVQQQHLAEFGENISGNSSTYCSSFREPNKLFKQDSRTNEMNYLNSKD